MKLMLDISQYVMFPGQRCDFLVALALWCVFTRAVSKNMVLGFFFHADMQAIATVKIPSKISNKTHNNSNDMLPLYEAFTENRIWHRCFQ